MRARMTKADRIILTGAGLYFAWSLVPRWFKFAHHHGLQYLLLHVPHLNAWNTVTTVAAVISIVAVLWSIERALGLDEALSIRAGLIDPILAGMATLFTLLGLLIQPSGYDVDAGLFVGIALALAWSYGAALKILAPNDVPSSAVDGLRSAL